jgi:sugar phosphate isomerase/epimerase
VDEVKRALEVADLIPFRFMVQHLGTPHEGFALEKFDAAYASLEVLQLFAKQRGVQLLLENIPNELSTPARLLEFLTYTRFSELRICFDTGHAHLSGSVTAAFEALQNLVLSTHVHDNQGERDDHLFPFEGTIPWPSTLRALAAGANHLPLQLELRDYGTFPRPLEKARETWAELEEMAAGPHS